MQQNLLIIIVMSFLLVITLSAIKNKDCSIRLIFLVVLTANIIGYVRLFRRCSLDKLTILILIIIYFGAIMILVAYVCAIIPNNVTKAYNKLSSFVISGVILFQPIGEYIGWIGCIPTYNKTSHTDRILNFLISPYGCSLFFLFVFIILILLFIFNRTKKLRKGAFRRRKDFGKKK